MAITNDDKFLFYLLRREDDTVCDYDGDILIFMMTRMIFVFSDSMFVMICVFPHVRIFTSPCP